MPQLDFSVLFEDFVLLTSFFIIFYLFIYNYLLPRLFKIIFCRKFYLESLDRTTESVKARLDLELTKTEKEWKKLFNLTHNLN